MTTHSFPQLAATYRDALLHDTLPFWFPSSLDTEHGGYLHCRDRQNRVIDTDKSVWAQGRMAWMLATLYNMVEPREEWLAWAQSGVTFLENHCFDTDGRMFFHVTREGQPIRKRRYAFSEAFASIAHAALARATGSDQHATRARELFQHFTTWNFTPGLMPPKFTDTRPMTGIGPRMIALVTAQELRQNLGDDPSIESWIDRCITEIEQLFLKPDLRCLLENVAPDGSLIDHFDGRTLNPGHAIECAWFILHEAQHRNDSRLVKLGTSILDWMWERGWDQEHGGILYFTDLHGHPVQEYWHDMKFWWPQNETVIATLLAFKLTGDPRYARMHHQIHEWAHTRFPDPEHGEWYGYLHRDGRISTTAKGNFWKSFFHLPRMQWYCWQLCQAPDDKPSPHSTRTS